MRNLKKILALVLALVMSFSLMATANAFTDDEQITDTYETAVTVLDGLKVFQGYDDGSFQPQSPIRRSEVAAIIYRIVTGDVTDAQVGIYADYNKFDDVKSTSWYAGYVNFCANAEYIKGRDARTFDPDSYVTGYEALAMILRAIGYDKNGEFTGSSWQVQTAATGELRGITKNITAGTLGTYASREVVAEILFQTILVDKVNYTPAFGYQLDDTSLGWDTFELESIEGVVVANEYADLYGTKPMKAGKTEMIVDGDSYVIDYASTLEDLGENHAAYITEGENVLAIAKTGNTVFETGAEANISTNSKFEDVTGLEKGDAEEYINFGGDGDAYESDWSIEYTVKFEAGAEARFEDEYDVDVEDTMGAAEGGVYEKRIRAGHAITEDDLAIIKGIFTEADDDDVTLEVQGAVYVGTQSNKDAEDVSDTMSYRSFYNEYITVVGDNAEVNYNENGNWLKVIDNDGDGEADYVLKTIYTAAGVEDINRDDEIELTPLYDDLDSDDEINQLTTDIDVVTADELSEGDVVYYAVIDGNAQTYLADVATAEIDEVDRNDLTAITTDGDEYVQSGVHNHIGWDGYDDGVRNLEGDTSYDLYLDKYGYLMAFTETAYAGDFALLTDGFFKSDRSEDTYAAMVWDGEELVDTDITDGGELFIYDKRNDNDWDNLKAFCGINDDEPSFRTIVAALSEDGELVPVEDSTNSHEVRIVAIDDNEILGRNYMEGTAYVTDEDDGWDKGDTAYDHDFNDNVEIRALSTTVYYFVYESKGETIVDEYVGYANVPDLYEDDLDLVQDVYAVGTLVDRESGLAGTQYYTANVVVVELDGNYRADAEQVFIYDTPVVGSSVKTEDVSMIREDGSAATVEIDLTRSTGIFDDSYGAAGDKRILPGLFYMWESSDEGVYIVERMTNADIAKNDYAVGQVATSLETMEYDWVELRLWNFESYTDLGATETNDYMTFGYVADESQVYGLDYSVEEINWRGDYTLVAELDDEIDAADALDERVDISRDRDANQENMNDDTVADSTLFWNNNDVLISYNSDDEIVYAISFNNYHDYSAAELADLPIVAQNIDFAQYVWNAVKPEAPYVPTYDANAEITVTLGTLAETEQVLNATNDDETYSSIDYADSDPVAHELTFNVDEGTSEVILVRQDGWDATEGAYVYNAIIRSEDGSETIEVKYTVNVETANTEAKLQVVEGTNGIITTDEENIGVEDNVDVNASQIVSMFEATKEEPYATVSWKFVSNSDGKTYTEDDLDVIGAWDESQFSSITATVTPQSGAPVEYTFEDVASVTVKLDDAEQGTDWVVSGTEYTPEVETDADVLGGNERTITENTVINFWTIGLTNTNGDDREVDPAKVVVEETNTVLSQEVTITRKDNTYSKTSYTVTTDNTAVTVPDGATASGYESTMTLNFQNVSAAATVGLTLS